MQFPKLSKLIPIALFIILAIMVTVVVFEGWAMVSAVAQNMFMIVLSVVFIGLIIYILWRLFSKEEERPTIAWKKKLENSARVSVPKQIRGHRLWVQGDQKHSPHSVGTIAGWTSLTHEYRVEKLDDKKKPILDKNKLPVLTPLRYQEDEYALRDQPDGKIARVLLHKKGEIKTWNESLFLVSLGGLLGNTLVYRVPETMHTDLAGDVFCSCISFIQKGEYMYPNTIYDQPEVEIMQRNEIRLESYYGLLDEIKLGVKKGMDSNPKHRMDMEQKKLIEVPVEG